jgi:Rrf2 family cysteine metabolism transcriptional repressor
MIRLSTHAGYALRAIVDIAVDERGEPVLRQRIAERQGISADYIAQPFTDLRHAELVEGVRGPGGGCQPASRASRLTVKDIVTAVEGPVALADCAIPKTPPSCSRVGRCAAHVLWKRMSASIEQLVDSVTLQDLRDEARELAAGEQ